MVVQHNIMALNSHRRLGVNNTAVGKNLEKLSSGYRINRAGDDAAGLAISEKMRAQIKGLEVAQRNAQDGISLVQTAEGALDEVHSMLKRMVELSTQAANGTYDDQSRSELQKEITKLNEEIDRIAEGTNFNDIKLLNGDLGKGDLPKFTGFEGVPNGKITEIAATSGESTVEMGKAGANPLNVGDKISITVSYTDASGKSNDVKIELEAKAGAGGANRNLVTSDGKVVFSSNNGSITAENAAEAFAAAAKENTELNSLFDVTANAKVLSFKTKQTGSAAKAKVNNVYKSFSDANITTGEVAGKHKFTAGVDKKIAYDLNAANMVDKVFTVNGQKFAFASNGNAGKLDKDVHYIEIAGNATASPTAAEVKKMAELVAKKTGIDPTLITNDMPGQAGTTNLVFTATPDNGGLSLQVGDTGEEFNQLTVAVNNMNSQALGVSGIDISTIDGARGAIDSIKSAINKVSSARSDLGAVQNRLEHTISNLSVAAENMTASESRIRDVDMAKEMMMFTQNNVLSQAAQAMLAQSNQQPQQILQLLR